MTIGFMLATIVADLGGVAPSWRPFMQNAAQHRSLADLLDRPPRFFRELVLWTLAAAAVLWPALSTGLLADDLGYRALGEALTGPGDLFANVEAQTRPVGTALLALLLGKLAL